MRCQLMLIAKLQPRSHTLTNVCDWCKLHRFWQISPSCSLPTELLLPSALAAPSCTYMALAGSDTVWLMHAWLCNEGGPACAGGRARGSSCALCAPTRRTCSACTSTRMGAPAFGLYCDMSFAAGCSCAAGLQPGFLLSWWPAEACKSRGTSCLRAECLAQEKPVCAVQTCVNGFVR